LKALSETLQFDLLVSSRTLSSYEDAEVVAREFRAHDLDLILLLCNSFTPEGSVVLPLADLPARLGLWALPEPTRRGPLQLTSLVSLNLFSSVLRSEGAVPEQRGKWFLGEVDDPDFRRRLEVTIRALRVVKGLKEATIGYVGGHAPGFSNLAFDEEALNRNLGVQVQALPLDPVIEAARDCGEDEAGERGSRIAARAAQVTWSTEDILATGRIALALERLSEAYAFSALAVACWPAFYEALGVFPCAVYGTLNAGGTIVACEGDVLGAVSLLALSLAGEARPVLMDMVSVEPAEEAVCFWHCGLATWDMADGRGVRLIRRPVPQPDGREAAVGGFAEVTFAADRTITIGRISRNGSLLLTAVGQTTDRLGPGYEGSGGWLTNLRMAHRPISPSEFLDAVVRSGIEHHYALVLQDVADPLLEAAAWLGLGIVQPCEVYDHM
jgi:L-fucose isomerase-like protein